ncbi:electron transport complex subunit RsxE, partial [Escherichia coli]|nr:electron transport complex subunit RsxE [Escherichia coli]
LRIQDFQFDNSFLLALLPPGAFIGVGLLIASKNVIDNSVQARQPKEEKPTI